MNQLHHLLPGAGAVGFARSIYGCLVFSQMHQRGGQTAKVGDVVVKQLGRFVHLVVITTIAHLNKKKQEVNPEWTPLAALDVSELPGPTC